ncbi:MAG: glycosyltransferase family 39 protein [Patescibacteria group bacterium]|nr:glycosyltransferase family 39 protein [Patescibacteria group bacterium]
MHAKITKNLLAVSWISIVIYFFYKNHAYYAGSLPEASGWLLYVLLIPLFYACYCLYIWFEKGKSEIKITLTFKKILAAIFLLTLITGNCALIIRDPSFYTGDDLVYEYDASTGIADLKQLSDPSEFTANTQLIAGNNSTLKDIHEAFSDWMPEELKPLFILPKTFNTEYGLITKIAAMMLIMGLITLTAISFGFSALKKLQNKKNPPLSSDNILVSLGLGLFAIALFSFLLGTINLLNIYGTWGLFIILLAISHKSLIKILKSLFSFKYEYKTKMLNINLLMILAIGLFLSMNFIDNISPAPRGWDGLNQYVNIAKRIFEEGGLIRMGGNYYWELFMSLGFTMFNWTTATLFLASFFPATICLFALYFVIKKFASAKSALFGTATLYLTPLFLFHGVEDNKIDLGNFAISIIAFLSLYLGIKSESKREKMSYITVAGLMAGFAFGIKLTSLMLILTGITMLLFAAYKWKGALSGLFFGTGLLVLSGNINMGTDIDPTNPAFKIAGTGLLIFSIGIIALEIFKSKSINGLKYTTTFALLAVLAFSPWLIKNFSESHSISSRGLLFGDHPQPEMNYQLMEEEYGLDRTLCTEATGTTEELDRYLGYSPFFQKYLTLPWHTTMNDQGTQGMYIDIKWAFLALIPAFLLFIPFKKPSRKWQILLVFGVPYWIFWTITSNGIIWYGLPGFIALTIAIAGLMDNYELNKDKFSKYLTNTVIILFIIGALVFRLSMAGKSPLLLYATDTITADQAELAIFPYAHLVEEIFREDQDGQYDFIWKIGTTLNYYIPDNFSRTYNDQYIDDLNCLYVERDPDLLTERLKALGYGYIIFDYYTFSLQSGSQDTLLNKYEAAIDYVLNHTELIVPDRYRGHLVAKIPNT